MTILTDLMPPTFSANTMSRFSNGTGQPGTETYAPSDYYSGNPSLGLPSGLRMVNIGIPNSVRYMGAVAAIPGRYIRISMRVRLIATPFCDVRIGINAFAVDGSAVTISDLPLTEIRTTATSFELSAVIGTGARPGVDIVLPSNATEYYAGLNMLPVDGVNSQLLVEEFRIEDVTAIYDADSSATIDVRDFGAIGDGAFDCTLAFAAADAAANGRTVLIPPGTYRLSADTAFENPVAFQGVVDMPSDKVLLLKKNYDLSAYANAFGSNEEGFKRAIGAMFNGVGHRDLDLCGRIVVVSEPIDMLRASRSSISQSKRRIRIFNGTFEPADSLSPVWNPTVITINGNYSSSSTSISDVANIDQVEVGMVLTSGDGVGREIYVQSAQSAQQRIILNLPLYGNPGNRNYTLTRYRYFLDFSGFTSISRLELENIEFYCLDKVSGVILPPTGEINKFSHCEFRGVGDRAITTPGGSSQGMMVEFCDFEQRKSSTDLGIAINASANDIKIRHCRAAYFQHFLVFSGQNALLLGNHVFQGLDALSRFAGIVLTQKSSRCVISECYIDNCFIEWTNEHDVDPTTGFPFGSLTITSTNFLASHVGSSFRFIVIKPLSDFQLEGLNVSGNNFSVFPASSAIDRVEKADETLGKLTAYSGINFSNNAYVNVNARSMNPCIREHTQSTAQSTWVVNFDQDLPFGLGPKHVDAITASSRITDGSNAPVWGLPHPDFGGAESEMRVYWPEATKGSIVVTARIDNADGR